MFRRLFTLCFCVGSLLFSTVVLAQCLPSEVAIVADRDNTLYQDDAGALSNGSGDYLFVGQTNFTNLSRRGLVHFDLDGTVPSGGTISEVSLQLDMNMTIGLDEAVNLHAVSADWGEGASHASGQEGGGAPSEADDATWLHSMFPTDFWASAGGDFDPISSALTVVDGVGIYEWSSPEMLADVESWLADPGSNYGWILIGNESINTTAKRFDSREGTDPGALPPTLCLTVQVPSIIEVPTLGGFGALFLALVLAAFALVSLRRYSCET